LRPSKGAPPPKKGDPISKIYPTRKRTGRVAQVVKRLLKKAKALSSKPRTGKKKRGLYVQ
jgi:hypothetical protein